MSESIIKEDSLPQNWDLISLSELVRMKGGTNADQNEDKIGFPVTRIETISNGEIDPKSVKYVDVKEGSEIYKKHIMKDGDILFSNINSPEHVGKTALYQGYPENLLHGMNLVLIRPNKNKIIPKYLEKCLQWLRFEGLFKNMCKTAINQASLAQKDIKPIKVPVPPLDEQERIVSVVEEKLERVERLEKSVENIGRLSEEYEDSLFSYVLINSRNSEEENISSGLPKDENIPDFWDIKYLSDLVEMEGGSRPTGGIDSYESDIPSIGGSEITSDGRTNLENPSMIPEDFYKSMRTGIIQSDDILLVKDGANTGDIAKISSDFSKDAAVNSHAYILRCTTDSIDPDYLSKYLRTPIVQSYIDQQAKGAAQKGINMSFADELSVPIPPLEEQKSMGQKIKNVDNTTNDLKTRYKQLETLFDEYKNSILSHAFQGDIDY